MAARVPARLTASQGRRFGLTVGLAFLGLAGIVLWRGHATTAGVLGGLGATLAFAGLVVPTRLGPVERLWMKLAHYISMVTTPIVMGVMYLLVLTPIGILRRLSAGNPLVHSLEHSGYWKARPEGKRRSSSMQRQY